MSIKEYTMCGRDPERTYRERRFHIRTFLPSMSACEVQKCIDGLDEDSTFLKGEIEESKSSIKQLRRETDPEALRQKFGISYPLSARKEDIIESFKSEISERKQTAKFVNREKAIYLWERRLRKTCAVQLPLIRLKLKELDKEAHDALGEIRGRLEQLDQLCDSYQKTSCEISELQAKTRKLSFDAQETMNSPPSLPPYMKDKNKQFLEALK